MEDVFSAINKYFFKQITSLFLFKGANAPHTEGELAIKNEGVFLLQ